MPFEPKKITKDHILEAIEIVNEKRVNNETVYKSTGWDLIWENEDYPPKEVMRYAHELMNGEHIWPNSGGEPTNKFLKKYGFKIVDKRKDIEHPIEFFNLDDLKSVKEWAGEPYNGSDYHKEIGKKLFEGAWTKTKYWTEEVARRCGLDSDIRRLWKNQGMQFSSYTWGKIRDDSAWTKEIYFTVGINNGGDGKPFLHIKMDYQFEKPKELTDSQIEVCKQLIRPNNKSVFYESSISFEEIKNYDWDKLLTETEQFVEEYREKYYDIINKVGDINPKYFTRICWNTNRWLEPSGTEGKSTSQESFEGMTGFGMEEWLFSEDLQVDGFQYGFLQGVNQDSPNEEYFDADLYTVQNTNEGKVTYWVCSIKDIQVINLDEAYSIQKKTGLEKKVNQYLKAIPDSNKINDDVASFVDDNFLNVKFKLSNVSYHESEDPQEVDLELSKYPRYRLYKGELFSQVSEVRPEEDTGLDMLGNASTNRNNSRKSSGRRSPGSYEIRYVHDQISRGVEAYLKRIMKSREKVNYEVPLGSYKKVDIVYEKPDEINLYEIKTNSELIFCIREGIGQLLEYGYYNRPEYDKRVNLILVSQHKSTEKLKKYMKKLRSLSEFNIYYQQYDEESKKLKQRI